MNKNINVVIVEDERHNSRLLEGLIEKIRPHWKVVAVLESVKESIDWFKEHNNPFLILLDIQLSDGICFSIFEQVEINSSTRIIFTTAYDEYAIRAFKVNSIDYLLKPIEEEELESAFSKYEELANINSPYLSEKDYYKDIIQSILAGKKEYRQRFLITGIDGYHKLETKSIAYFYSENKITFAVDFKNKEYTIDYNLEQLESELDPIKFFRANRKTILNIDSVHKLTNETGGKLIIHTIPSPEFEIVVSRLKAGEFKEWVGK